MLVANVTFPFFPFTPPPLPLSPPTRCPPPSPYPLAEVDSPNHRHFIPRSISSQLTAQCLNYFFIFRNFHIKAKMSTSNLFKMSWLHSIIYHLFPTRVPQSTSAALPHPRPSTNLFVVNVQLM